MDTDAGNKPTIPVVINSIVIRKVGVIFDDRGGGTYDFGIESGTITSYKYTPDGCGAGLQIKPEALVMLRYRFGHDATIADLLSGRHSGTAYASPPFSISGTFTLTR